MKYTSFKNIPRNLNNKSYNSSIYIFLEWTTIFLCTRLFIYKSEKNTYLKYSNIISFNLHQNPLTNPLNVVFASFKKKGSLGKEKWKSKPTVIQPIYT